AEIDVDDVGPGRLDDPRRLGHHARLRAEDLDRERVLVARDAQVAERPLVAVVDPGAAHHLGADEPGAEAAALPAERLDADAGHRRQDDAASDLDGPDAPRFAEIRLHEASNRSSPRVASPATHRLQSPPATAPPSAAPLFL